MSRHGRASGRLSTTSERTSTTPPAPCGLKAKRCRSIPPRWSSMSRRSPGWPVSRGRRRSSKLRYSIVATSSSDLEGANQQYQAAIDLEPSEPARHRLANKLHRPRLTHRDGARLAFYEHGGGAHVLRQFVRTGDIGGRRSAVDSQEAPQGPRTGSPY